MKRNVLGKGIAAIISNDTISSNRYKEIDIDQIHPNPHQPRKAFSQEKIQELAESMKESGLIQPVVVYKQDEKYYIIVGERRWRAAQYLKWEKIPVLIRDVAQNELVMDSLIENIQRENLNPLEIALAIENMSKLATMTYQQIASKIGMNRTTVSNFVRLLKLPDLIKEWIVEGKLDQGHARTLLSLETENQMIDAGKLIIKNSYSVRDAEKMVKRVIGRATQIEKKIDPDLDRIEKKLMHHFSTKVKINYSSSGKGILQIYFHSFDEFQRILAIFNKESK